MDKQEFINGINKLEMAYNQKFTTEKLKFWWDKLKNINTDRYIQKIDELIQSKSYMPSIAEILDNRQTLSNYKQRDYSNYDFSELYANNFKRSD